MNPDLLSTLPLSAGMSEDFKKVITDRFDGVKQITPDLLRALRSGDTDAYKALYNIAHRPLYVFISRAYPKFDAEEITQAVMVEVWEKRVNIDPGRNFGGYLFRMAVSHANKLYRRRLVELSYLQNSQNEHHYAETPDDILIEEQTRLLYDIVLSQMPGRRRKVYEMYRNEGMTYEEIAVKLKLSRNKVAYDISMAKKQLSELLTLFAALISISQIH